MILAKAPAIPATLAATCLDDIPMRVMHPMYMMRTLHRVCTWHVGASERRLMAIAVAVSLAVHLVLFAIRFAPPLPSRALPFDSRLPVILVNARSHAEPLQADALAQASLDGGGDAEAGRVRSPLPDLAHREDGSRLDAQRRRVAELEDRQERLLRMLVRQSAAAADADAPMPAQPDGRQHRQDEPAPSIARRQAEIARDIADYQARPLKMQLSPRTREVPYALYYTALQKKIEQTGTLYFPQSGGVRLYGELIMTIPLRQNGALYEGDGGPRVDRSSGNPALDAAALAIVRRAAPFGHLPAMLHRDGHERRERVWEVVARFSFTREQRLETQLSAGGQP